MERTDQEKFIHIGPPTQLRQLKTPCPVEGAKAVLQSHGCTCQEHADAYIIYFPEGTTRTEKGLRTLCEHYQIQLPDGSILYEDYDRQREISLLWYSRE